MAQCRSMTTQRTTTARELATLVPPLLLVLGLLQTATARGAGHLELLLACLAVAGTQILPGALLWRLVRPVDGWLVEDLVLGLGIGAALAVPTHVLALSVGWRPLDAVLPLAIAAAVLGFPGSRRRVLSRQTGPLPMLWGASVTACSVLPVLAVLDAFRSPLRFHGWAKPYVDMPYHQALAGELMHRFPPHYPQVALEPLTYHWFVHAWTSQVSSVSGTPLEVLLWRFNPSLLVVAVPILTAVAAMRLSRRVWVGPAAAAIAFLLLDVAPWARSSMATPLHSPMSPTMQYGLLVFLTLLVVIAMRWRGEISRWSVLLLVLLLVVSGGAKGSTLPVLVAGGLLACLAVLMTDRARLRMVGMDTALALVIMLVLNRLMFGGGSGGVRLSWVDSFIRARGATILGPGFEAASPAGVTAGLLTLLALVLGYVGLVGVLTTREDRTDPLAWLLIGCAISGVCAVLFLSHPGQAQWYFYKTAETPFAIVAAWGTGVLLTKPRSPARLVARGVVTGIVALTVTHLAFVWGRDDRPGVPLALLALAVFALLLLGGAWLTTRAEGRATTVVVALVAVAAAGAVPAAEVLADWSPAPAQVRAKATASAIHSSDVRALHWLRDHSDPDDVVMTNQHCLGKVWAKCDRRRFYVSAYSERGVLVEGWAYTREASRAYDPDGPLHYSQVPFWDPDLLALNDGFIAGPTAESATELWKLGVRWAVVWNQAPHADTLEPLARLRLRGDHLSIYELVPVER